MKIIAPLVNADEVLPLAAAGADEFYFGLGLTRNIDDRSGLNVMAINRANLRSIPEARRAIALAHKGGQKMAVCFNSEVYSPVQIREIIRLLRLIPAVDSVVACDIMLIRRIRQAVPDLAITVGTRANIMNSAAVDYYKGLGARRFVLPRHLDLRSVQMILAGNKGLSFEIFVKNEDCPYVNGLCTLTHNLWNDAQGSQIFCRGSAWKRVHSWCGGPAGEGKEQAVNAFMQRLVPGCAACFLPEIAQAGNRRVALKLTSRLRPLPDRLKDVIFFRQISGLLKLNLRSNAFRTRCCQAYLTVFGRSCSRNCYYEK
ncbi:MAG: U32 family peptidase [Candidatus Omnitrophica bacterium]|nr:U32 family peptidase [Candidatus Omnitrophota bacterium]